MTDDEARDTDDWETKPSKLNTSERDFIVPWFSEQQTPIPADYSGEITCGDSDFVYKLLSIATALPLTTAIPNNIRDKRSLTTKFLNRRAHDIGRIPKILRRFSGKTYDMTTGGPYILTFAEDRLVKINHIVGGEMGLPAPIHISGDYKVTNWWCDKTAAAELHPSKVLRKGVFQPPTGPPQELGESLCRGQASRRCFLERPCAGGGAVLTKSNSYAPMHTLRRPRRLSRGTGR